MKKSVLSLVAMAAILTGLAATSSSLAEEKKGPWAPLISGKTAEERWASIGKTAPHLLGMTRADVEKNLGKGAYSEKQQELTYQITDPATAKTNIYDNISISFDKDGHVNHFVTIAKTKD